MGLNFSGPGEAELFSTSIGLSQLAGFIHLARELNFSKFAEESFRAVKVILEFNIHGSILNVLKKDTFYGIISPKKV